MTLTPDVLPGEIIQTAWGDAIRDRTVQRFDTVAARDAEWPDAEAGAVCWTQVPCALWLRRMPPAPAPQVLGWVPHLLMPSSSAQRLASVELGQPCIPPAVPGVFTVASGQGTVVLPGLYALTLLLTRGAAPTFVASVHLRPNVGAQERFTFPNQVIGGGDTTLRAGGTVVFPMGAGDMFELRGFPASAGTNTTVLSSVSWLGPVS